MNHEHESIPAISIPGWNTATIQTLYRCPCGARRVNSGPWIEVDGSIPEYDELRRLADDLGQEGRMR